MSDPLSDILSLICARSSVSAGLITGGAWAIRTSSYAGMKFNSVLRGVATLLVDGELVPVQLCAGDCFVLTSGAPFVIGSDLSLPPADAGTVFAGVDRSMAQYGTGDDFAIIGGRMLLDVHDAALLLTVLPQLIVIRAGASEAECMQWLVTRLMDELHTARPGHAVMSAHLMQMLFVESIRAWLATEPASRSTWLGALADPRVSAAMRAMHSAPAQVWTLEKLASIACMSRSSFAGRFKKLVGAAPLDYLMKWRMRLAGRELRNTARPVSLIARSLGYGSDSAFSNAFKRVYGVAPLVYRNVNTAASGKPDTPARLIDATT